MDDKEAGLTPNKGKGVAGGGAALESDLSSADEQDKRVTFEDQLSLPQGTEEEGEGPIIIEEEEIIEGNNCQD